MIPSRFQTLFLAVGAALFLVAAAHAQRELKDVSLEPTESRSVLAPAPDWSVMTRYANTATPEEVESQLRDIYSEPGRTWLPWLKVESKDGKSQLRIVKASADRLQGEAVIPLASKGEKEPASRFWRPASTMDVPQDAGKPLTGVKIAIDPGHIGGAFAELEARWFKIGEQPPVMEGEMALVVAQILRTRLEAMGAEVVLVRSRNAPVTRIRPVDLDPLATKMLQRQGVPKPPQDVVRNLSQKLFAIAAEIRARGELVNLVIKPDLVVCLHFNAAAWGDPKDPQLVEGNHFHVLTNGCYAPSEIALDDQRADLVHKLFQSTAKQEIGMADAVARRLVGANPLPAFTYNTPIARRVNDNPYVWARNLLASRIYECPVVYMEPYVMNNEETFARVQAGAYEGRRTIAGKVVPNIFAEYADAVADGLGAFFHYQRTMPTE